jgi:putative transposase
MAGRDLVNAVRNDLLQEQKDLSMTKLCRWLAVPRSTTYYQPRQQTAPPPVDGRCAMLIYEIIETFPFFGIRRVWAYLKHVLGELVNRKKVARIMRRNGWTVKQRKAGKRPRVEGKASVAGHPNERWSTDLAFVFCGAKDGWCSFVPVLDCCTREVLGWELAPTGRAKTAERALEAALIERFGHVRLAPAGLMLRHDNGLVFGSKLYRGIVRDYGLQQEFITPYTPEENGLCERFIRSFKEEVAWIHRFECIEQARRKIVQWVHWYNTERPHQALEYMNPVQYRQKITKKVA